MNNFGGMKILWIFFWGHHKFEQYLGVISMHFGVFSYLRSKWEIFWGVGLGSFLKVKLGDIFGGW